MLAEYIKNKILSADELIRQGGRWRLKSKRIVFTNGCFDIFHPGHLHILSEAKSFGDMLVVGLNTDSSVKRLKGAERPIHNEEQRAQLLAALKLVDAVVLFDEDTPLELIKSLKPEVLVKGADYKISEVVGATEVQAYGGSVRLVELLSGHSSSAIIDA